MVRRGKRRAAPPRPGQDAIESALTDLKAIGGLVVARSVGLRGDAADQLVFLGKQILARAEDGMAALGMETGPPSPP